MCEKGGGGGGGSNLLALKLMFCLEIIFACVFAYLSPCFERAREEESEREIFFVMVEMTSIPSIHFQIPVWLPPNAYRL